MGEVGVAQLEPGAERRARPTRVWRRVRTIADALLDGFEEHDLLTYASAISFQILTAIVPFFLFVLAVAGLLGGDSFWRNDLAPEIHANVSSGIFTTLSSAVDKAFSERQAVWATFGGALALWQVSGAVRAVMGVLNSVYRAETRRSFTRRMLISFGLAVAVGACFLLAALSLLFGPFFFDAAAHGPALAIVGFVARWGLAIACLFLAVGLLVHVAPATPQPVGWVSLGSLIVIGTWILTSVAFAFYLSSIASYDSIFGGVASLIVLMGYLYVSATGFLLGVQIDALVRTEVKGTAAGVSHGTQKVE